MYSRLTILHKGLFLIAVPLLFQIVFVGLVALMRRDGMRAVNWTIHTKDVIAQAQTSRVALLAAHGTIQGYIITRDESFATTLDGLVASIPGEIEILKVLVIDRDDQSRAAAKIEQEVKDLLAFMNEGRRIVGGGSVSAALAKDRRLRAQEMLNVLDADFDRFIALERALDRERNKALKLSRAAMDVLLMSGIASSVCFTSLLAILFSRNISERIAHLSENTSRLAVGKELTPPISGGDEIARLDSLFHEMARTLAESNAREKKHARLLEQRAEELDSVNAQLRDKAQENEMFVYSVSHDLRSPLVNLQGFSKELGMLGQDLARLVEREGVPPEIRRQAKSLIEVDMAESIGFIQTAVVRLSGIIDGLLRLSRAGQVEFHKQIVKVGPIVARVVGALRGTIDERKATIEVAGLSTAWGDPAAIEQIFANLIGNAVNYLDKDRPGRIEVFEVDPLETKGPAEGIAPGSVVFAVRDNGLGISDSYKPKVFAVFQRLHGDVAQGEGVGLALVRRVVERHAGRIWFESRAGEGTTFFVALPSAEPLAIGPDETGDDLPLILESKSENGSLLAWESSR